MGRASDMCGGLPAHLSHVSPLFKVSHVWFSIPLAIEHGKFVVVEKLGDDNANLIRSVSCGDILASAWVELPFSSRQ